MGMTGMLSDLVNVKTEYINMTAIERNTNRNFPCPKTMGTKPWENKNCFLKMLLPKFGEILTNRIFLRQRKALKKVLFFKTPN